MSAWRPTKESIRLIHEQRQQFDDFRRKSLGDVASRDLDVIQKIMMEEEEQYTSRLREAAQVVKVGEEAVRRISADEERVINVEKAQEEDESMMLVRQIVRQEYIEMHTEEDPASTKVAAAAAAAAAPSVSSAQQPPQPAKNSYATTTMDMEAAKRKEIEAFSKKESKEAVSRRESIEVLSRRESEAALLAREAGFMTAEDCAAVLAALEADMADFQDSAMNDDDNDHASSLPQTSLEHASSIFIPQQQQQHRNEVCKSAALSCSDDDGSYDCLQNYASNDVAASTTATALNESTDVLPYETCIDISNTLGDVRLENWQQIAEMEIGRLPVEMYDPNEGERNKSNHPCETVCMICQCSYEEDDILRRLPCNHCFHATCVDEWLMKQDTCPCCRKHII